MKTSADNTSRLSHALNMWMIALAVLLLALTTGPKHADVPSHSDQLTQISSSFVSLQNREITGRNDTISVQPLLSLALPPNAHRDEWQGNFTSARFLSPQRHDRREPLLRPQSRAPPAPS